MKKVVPALEGYIFTVATSKLAFLTCLDDFVSQELFIRGKKNGKCKDEVSFFLTFPKMNTYEGQAGNLFLETVNPKNLESPSE